MRPRHLPGLDALRGIAALMVLLMHASYLFDTRMLAVRGYLAVDFFFMLSGFVLAHTYGERLLAGMSPDALIGARVRRLYPMVMLGVALGTAASIAAGTPWLAVVETSLSGALLIPTLHGNASANLYPVDAPLWTLFWELVASIAFARTLWRLSTPRLIAIQLASFATLAWLASQYGTIEIGFERRHIAGGAARVGFAFVTGMLLHRWWMRRPGVVGGRSTIGLAAALVLIATVTIPARRDVLDLAATALLFPPLIIAAARIDRIAWPWRVGAAISYPLYSTHIPILDLVQRWHAADQRISAGLSSTLGVGWCLLIAWLAYHGLDRPARAWLSLRHAPVLPASSRRHEASRPARTHAA